MEVKPKDKFRHFKGDIMTVVCIAKHTETLEDFVIYEHFGQMWARPLSMFLSDEDISSRVDNITGQKHRFEKIEEEK